MHSKEKTVKLFLTKQKRLTELNAKLRMYITSAWNQM